MAGLSANDRTYFTAAVVDMSETLLWENAELKHVLRALLNACTPEANGASPYERDLARQRAIAEARKALGIPTPRKPRKKVAKAE